MKIAILSPIQYPTPNFRNANSVIASFLADGLISQGIETTLFASRFSKTKARLVHFNISPQFKDKKKGLDFEFLFTYKAYEKIKKEKFDLVHCHFFKEPYLISSLVNVPTLFTLHDPLTNPRYQLFLKKIKNKNAYFVSISNSQRFPLPSLRYVSTVYNGIRLKDFEYQEKPKDYFVFLGRFSPKKGAHIALQLARRLDLKLCLVGEPQEKYFDYWKKEIRPYLRSKKIKHIKVAIGRKKNNLLKNARGLLFPVLWEEPFGLVMIEAMACGTPVIGFSRGSVPEVVKDGRTGFVVRNINEMAQAIKRIGQINRRECRRLVQEKFTCQKMVDDYLRVYKKIISKK